MGWGGTAPLILNTASRRRFTVEESVFVTQWKRGRKEPVLGPEDSQKGNYLATAGSRTTILRPFSPYLNRYRL